MFYFNLLMKLSLIKSAYYSFKFKAKIFVGKNVKLRISKSARLQPIRKGDSLFIGVHMNGDYNTSVELKDNSEMRFGKSVCINKGCKLVIGKNAVFTIDDKSFINEQSVVYCMKQISIGKNCAIAWNVTIMDSDMHKIIKDGMVLNNDKAILISNKVWIGVGSIILKGTLISDNVIVAAGSIITNKLEVSNKVYVGHLPKQSFEDWK